jgi:hypothetical protein
MGVETSQEGFSQWIEEDKEKACGWPEANHKLVTVSFL